MTWKVNIDVKFIMTSKPRHDAKKFIVTSKTRHAGLVPLNLFDIYYICLAECTRSAQIHN